MMSDPRKGGCNETPQVGAQICPGFMKAGNIQHKNHSHSGGSPQKRMFLVEMSMK